VRCQLYTNSLSNARPLSLHRADTGSGLFPFTSEWWPAQVFRPERSRTPVRRHVGHRWRMIRFQAGGRSMSFEVKTKVDQRLEFVWLAREEGANVRALCRRFGISPLPAAPALPGRWRGRPGRTLPRHACVHPGLGYTPHPGGHRIDQIRGWRGAIRGRPASLPGPPLRNPSVGIGEPI
jgi:hypothetical protein